MRKIRVIAIIIVILFGSFIVSRVTDPEEIVPVLPPWDVEAVINPPIGTLTWPPGDPILGVVIGTESRAYLLSLMEWHGVLNDRMSGQDIAVTYSLLSDSGAVYNRTIDDRVLVFEVHDGIYKNGLVLRDRQTGSLWSQMDGRAIMGPLKGRTLARVPAVRTTWSGWEALHPSTQVLLPPGDRDYGIHMFGDYKTNERILFPYRYEDSSLKAKDAVLGVNIDGQSVAFPLSRLSVERIVTQSVGSETILVTYAFGTAFVYDAGNWSFDFVSGSTMEDHNSDRWNMTTGQRENDGFALTSLQANVTVCYWFAWLNIYPDTSLYGIEQRDVLERTWIVGTLPWTVGLLLCLMVIVLNRFVEGRPKDRSRPLRWTAYGRSVLLATAALLACVIILLDSPRNLQVGNVAQQALFGVSFLILGLAMAYEWYHARGYEFTTIPIDMSEFRDNLVSMLATLEMKVEELAGRSLGWVRTKGGYALSEPDAEMLFHEERLFMGSPKGLSDQDMAQLKRIVDQSMTAMEEGELA